MSLMLTCVLAVFTALICQSEAAGKGVLSQSTDHGAYAPFQLPLGAKPLQVPLGTNPFLPVHPATHMFANQFEWNSGHNGGFGVDFRFPILDRKAGLKYPWDFEFNYREQREHVGWDYGHVVHPQKKGRGLAIPFDQVMLCVYLPEACTNGGAPSHDVVAKTALNSPQEHAMYGADEEEALLRKAENSPKLEPHFLRTRKLS